MRPLSALLLLLLLAHPAASATLTYTVDIENNGLPLAQGVATLDLTPGSAGRIDVLGQSDLDQAPVTQMTWVAELLLANAWTRWTSAVATPAPSGAKETTGFVAFLFGAAGYIEADYGVDFIAGTGAVDIRVFNWVPGQFYEPGEPFWVELHEDLEFQSQGQVDTEGCVLLNGIQVATLSGSSNLTPSQNLSALPDARVRSSVLVTQVGPDEVSLDGDILVDETQDWVVQLFVDEGQGWVISATGSLSMDPSADPQRFSFAGNLGIINQSPFGNLLFLMDLTVIPMFRRLYYPQTPWAGVQPEIVTGVQTLDVGLAGTVGVTIYADNDFVVSGGTRLLQVGVDITQSSPFSGPGNSWDVHTTETFTGLAQGGLGGVGTVYFGGSPVVTYTGSYGTSPAINATSQGSTVVEVESGHSVVFPGPTMFYSGAGRTDTATTAAFTTTLQSAGQSFQGAGSFTFLPLQIDDPNAAEQPNKSNVLGQIVFDTALPTRALILAELPAITAWLRHSASLSQSPGATGLVLGELLVDTGVGYGTGLISIDPDQDTIDSDVDMSSINPAVLATLLNLPPKFWVNLGSTTQDDEGEQVEVDHDCITICEEDPQTQEVICTAFCQVRARVRRETYPDKTGGDPFRELDANTLLCVEFSPDNKTVTFTGEFLLQPYEGPTAVPAPATTFSFAAPFPNPSTGASTFSFVLPATSAVTLDLYDARGRRVRRVIEGDLGAGPHTLGWDGQDDSGRAVASGVYWARLRAGSELSVRRLLVVR